MSIEFRQEGKLGKAISLCWTGLDEDRGARAEFRRFDRAVQDFLVPFRALYCVFPTCVGMNRTSRRYGSGLHRVPHVRGDEPSDQ